MANTFTASLRKLTSQEQRAVKTTAFDLQTDPSRPSLKFHRVDGSRDPNFWTVRVNRDLRIVVHKHEADLLLAYVDRHDDAYAWAERRRIDVHPKTGAAQIVEVREFVQKVSNPTQERYEPQPARTDGPRLFDPWTDEDILACGVPEDWLPDVRAADEDRLLDLAAHLPAEASEALLNLAVGVRPDEPDAPPEDPFDHPDAQRRFRLFDDSEELEAALDSPWDAWTVFLHPSQRATVDGRIAWDRQSLLKTMTVLWKEVFGTVLGASERSYVSELLEVRNRLAHNDAFTYDDAERALDTMRRLLEAVGAREIAEKIGNERDAILRVKYAELGRAAVEPHPNVAEGDKAQKEQEAREAKRAEQAEQNTPTSQRDSVDRDFAGPARVSESAGTGQYDGAALIERFNGNKSAAIRYLAAEGLKCSQIAKILRIRYQFAYNVLKADAGKEGRGR